MGVLGGLRILPVELLCEILSYLNVEESVRMVYMSGDMVLRNKVSGIGGLKEVRMVEGAEPGDFSRVVGFSGMTTLEIELSPQYRILPDIGWVKELPGTLKRVSFKFSGADLIWLHPLRSDDRHGPYPFLYEAHGYIPIPLKTQFPNLKSFEMDGGFSNVLHVSSNESTIRMPDGAASREVSVYWTHAMFAYFLNHLPTELHTLRSGLFHLFDIPHITLPKSLTRLHSATFASKIAPPLASIGSDASESLIQLTWSTHKEDLSEFAKLAPHLRSLQLHCPSSTPAAQTRPPRRSISRSAGSPNRPSPSSITFPSYLRVLRLSAPAPPWIDSYQARSYLQALPATLHTLELNCHDFFHFDAPLIARLPRDLTTLILSDRLSVSQLSGFPSGLRHMAVHVKGDSFNFSTLPASLTRFECQTNHIATVEDLEKLPKGLLRVKLGFNGIQDRILIDRLIMALPRSIVHLELIPFPEWSYASVAALPRALEVLKLGPGSTLSEEVLAALPRTLKRFGEPTIVISASTLPLNTSHMDSEVILRHIHTLLPRGIAKRHQIRWKSSMWGWTAPSTIQAVVVGVSGHPSPFPSSVPNMSIAPNSSFPPSSSSLSSSSSSLSSLSTPTVTTATMAASNSTSPSLSASSSNGIPFQAQSQLELKFTLPPALTSLDLSEIPLSANQEQELLGQIPTSVTHLTCSVMCSGSVLARLRHLTLPHLHTLSAFYQIYATSPLSQIEVVQPIILNDQTRTVSSSLLPSSSLPSSSSSSSSSPSSSLASSSSYSGWQLTELRLPSANWLSFLEPPLTLEVLEVKHIESRLLTPLISLHTLIQSTAHHSTTRMQDLPHSLTYLSISLPSFLMGSGAPSRPASIGMSNGICIGSSSGGGSGNNGLGVSELLSSLPPGFPSSSAPSSPLVSRIDTKGTIIGQRLLPPKLKSMIAPKSIVSRALFEALPPSVTFVKIGQLYVHDVKEMLIHLGDTVIEHLDFITLSGTPPASYIAPCTAKVECGPWEMQITEEDMRSLPRGLRSFTAPNITLLRCFIPTLPSSLTSLDLRKLRPPIAHDAPQRLPRSLLTLFVDCSLWTSDSFLGLPPNLTYLHISSIKAFRKQHAQKLPKNIKTLIIDCRRIFDSTLSHLPTTIRHLSLPEAYAITLRGISLLPRQLRSLVLERLPDSSWKDLVAALPPTLAQLHPLGKSLHSNTEFKKIENLATWQNVLGTTGVSSAPGILN